LFLAVEDSMSDAHDHHDDSPHEGPIKTPKQLIVAVFFAFVVPIIAIILLVSFVAADKRPAAGSAGLQPEATARRIQPVGTIDFVDASAPRVLLTGEQVYQAQCAACHAAGLAGAPKFGDAALWAPRLKTGFDALVTSALKGKGGMPAQGGTGRTDVEIARAVAYMANAAGGKFEEPKAPAAAASAPVAETAAPAVAAAASTAPAAAPAAPAVTSAPATPVPAATTTAAAPALYTQSCAMCHVAGLAGAPKLGDKAAWAPRLAQGVDGLTASVIKGKGAMPPRGGSQGSDADLKAVVTYMVNASK
jgi:cytochrome c5